MLCAVNHAAIVLYSITKAGKSPKSLLRLSYYGHGAKPHRIEFVMASNLPSGLRIHYSHWKRDGHPFHPSCVPETWGAG